MKLLFTSYLILITAVVCAQKETKRYIGKHFGEDPNFTIVICLFITAKFQAQQTYRLAEITKIFLKPIL